jgi:uncharacterized protein (TIGR00730 family)
VKRLAVYCGSASPSDPVYIESARAVGRTLAERGIGVVYGGGRLGLMGAIADSALEAGGEVIGIIPQALVAAEVAHRGLTELHVVDTMHQRKQLMAERSDAFLALPGGIGTFEELFEVWTWRQLGYHDKPVGLLNVGGYYDQLLSFLDVSVDDGFVAAPQRELLQVATDPAELLGRLAAQARTATAPDDYRKI